MEKEISLIDSKTIKSGKLEVVSIVEDGVHPSEWELLNYEGRGKKIHVLKYEDKWLTAVIGHDDIWKIYEKEKPKKIYCEYFDTNYGKERKFMRVGGRGPVELKDLYVLRFVEKETGLVFNISNIQETLDWILPNTKEADDIKVYWRCNPWAGNGTGWRGGWTDPTYVDVILKEPEVIEYSKIPDRDLFGAMARTENYLNANLKYLEEYTKLKFA